MLLVEALALNKCLLGEMKYIYKTKSLKACLQNLFMKNKAKQKNNNNDNNNKDTNSLLS